MNILGRGFSFQPNTHSFLAMNIHNNYGYCPYVVGSAIGVVPYSLYTFCLKCLV